MATFTAANTNNNTNNNVLSEDAMRIGAVQLDGLALLKMLTHGHDSLPELCTGQLLGLEIDGRVEVTNCFAMPHTNANGVIPPPATQTQTPQSTQAPATNATAAASTTGNVTSAATASAAVTTAAAAAAAAAVAAAQSNVPGADGVVVPLNVAANGTMTVEDFQLDMLKSMRAVNVDHNTVGWYTSAYFANYFNAGTIEQQLSYQVNIPASVLLVHDPYQSTKGRLVLKAYRLSDAFMRIAEREGIHSGSSTAAIVATVTQASHELEWHDMLEELPIKVHNSHLVHGFLYELRESKTMKCDAERLSFWPWSGPFLQRAMTLLSESVDEYQQEAGRLGYYQRELWRQKQAQQNHLARRQQENEQRVAAGKDPLPDEDLSKNPLFKSIARPTRVEAHTAANQIAYAAGQVQQAANQGIHKLYLMSALHKA